MGQFVPLLLTIHWPILYTLFTFWNHSVKDDFGHTIRNDMEYMRCHYLEKSRDIKLGTYYKVSAKVSFVIRKVLFIHLSTSSKRMICIFFRQYWPSWRYSLCWRKWNGSIIVKLVLCCTSISLLKWQLPNVIECYKCYETFLLKYQVSIIIS